MLPKALNNIVKVCVCVGGGVPIFQVKKGFILKHSYESLYYREYLILKVLWTIHLFDIKGFFYLWKIFWLLQIHVFS